MIRLFPLSRQVAMVVILIGRNLDILRTFWQADLKVYLPRKQVNLFVKGLTRRPRLLFRCSVDLELLLPAIARRLLSHFADHRSSRQSLVFQ